MDREWLDAWRVSVTAALTELLDTFSQRYGFEPDVHAVGPPASREAVASLAALRATSRSLMAWQTPQGVETAAAICRISFSA